jgi:hypothetical protein
MTKTGAVFSPAHLEGWLPKSRSATVPGRSNVQNCNHGRFLRRIRAAIAIFSPVLDLGNQPSSRALASALFCGMACLLYSKAYSLGQSG